MTTNPGGESNTSKKPIEFSPRYPIEVEKKLYGDKFIVDLEKRHFKFTSKYEEHPAYINFNQVERFTVKYDPKNYLWVVGFILLFVVVGLIVLIYKMNLPSHKIEIEKKNGTIVKFRLNMEPKVAEALVKAVQLQL
jgi:hypothetical protein